MNTLTIIILTIGIIMLLFNLILTVKAEKSFSRVRAEWNKFLKLKSKE